MTKTIGQHVGELVVSDTDKRTSSASLDGTGFAIRTVRTAGTGTITDNNGLINCSSECQAKVADANQRTITLTETPAPFNPDGSVFVRWEDGCTGTEATCTVGLTENTASQPYLGSSWADPYPRPAVGDRHGSAARRRAVAISTAPLANLFLAIPLPRLRSLSLGLVMS